MGRILIHLIPNPWLFGPSSTFPSSPRLTSTATPPSILYEDWIWCGEGCAQVCTEQSQGKHDVSSHLRLVGHSMLFKRFRESKSLLHQFRYCVVPDVEAAISGGCLSAFGWGGRPRRRADTWLSFLTPTWAWTIISAVGGRGSLVVVGSLSHRAGSPGTFETCTYPASISMSEREAFHSKNQTPWQVERNWREGGKLDTLRALFFIFLNKDLHIFILPNPANYAASPVNSE